MATKTIEHYEEQGVIATLMQDFSQRPVGGWQQKAYDRGAERERERTALKKEVKASDYVRSKYLNDWNMTGLPAPVQAHLTNLNEQYRKEGTMRRAQRLANSMDRVMTRWKPGSA